MSSQLVFFLFASSIRCVEEHVLRKHYFHYINTGLVQVSSKHTDSIQSICYNVVKDLVAAVSMLFF